ncbi:hypothetical protein WAI453_010235 [Rhynchosporium graminicola]|uniref:Uncharacterized protein n=1 Tax=Rhynchosporium graminicola TaxID=2792576 RepID=A0A1E1KFV4_9HELO|nr:uncharacterized protein RCO7_02668 [Rhynchosporium commune]
MNIKSRFDVLASFRRKIFIIKELYTSLQLRMQALMEESKDTSAVESAAEVMPKTNSPELSVSTTKITRDSGVQSEVLNEADGGPEECLQEIFLSQVHHQDPEPLSETAARINTVLSHRPLIANTSEAYQTTDQGGHEDACGLEERLFKEENGEDSIANGSVRHTAQGALVGEAMGYGALNTSDYRPWIYLNMTRAEFLNEFGSLENYEDRREEANKSKEDSIPDGCSPQSDQASPFDQGTPTRGDGTMSGSDEDLKEAIRRSKMDAAQARYNHEYSGTSSATDGGPVCELEDPVVALPSMDAEDLDEKSDKSDTSSNHYDDNNDDENDNTAEISDTDDVDEEEVPENGDHMAEFLENESNEHNMSFTSDDIANDVRIGRQPPPSLPGLIARPLTPVLDFRGLRYTDAEVAEGYQAQQEADQAKEDQGRVEIVGGQTGGTDENRGVNEPQNSVGSETPLNLEGTELLAPVVQEVEDTVAGTEPLKTTISEAGTSDTESLGIYDEEVEGPETEHWPLLDQEVGCAGTDRPEHAVEEAGQFVDASQANNSSQAQQPASAPTAPKPPPTNGTAPQTPNHKKKKPPHRVSPWEKKKAKIIRKGREDAEKRAMEKKAKEREAAESMTAEKKSSKKEAEEKIARDDTMKEKKGKKKFDKRRATEKTQKEEALSPRSSITSKQGPGFPGGNVGGRMSETDYLESARQDSPHAVTEQVVDVLDPVNGLENDDLGTVMEDQSCAVDAPSGDIISEDVQDAIDELGALNNNEEQQTGDVSAGEGVEGPGTGA